MASPGEVLKKYLIDQGTANAHDAVAGANVWPSFVSSMPDKPDQAVVFLDDESIKQARLMNGEVIEKPTLIINMRAKTFSSGFAKMMAIQNKIDAIYKVSVNIDDEDWIIHSIMRPARFASLGAEQGTNSRLEWFSLNLIMTIHQVVMSDFNSEDFSSADFS